MPLQQSPLPLQYAVGPTQTQALAVQLPPQQSASVTQNKPAWEQRHVEERPVAPPEQHWL
jgi:hypothetical protein